MILEEKFKREDREKAEVSRNKIGLNSKDGKEWVDSIIRTCEFGNIQLESKYVANEVT
jgi:hypothetical protein